MTKKEIAAIKAIVKARNDVYSGSKPDLTWQTKLYGDNGLIVTGWAVYRILPVIECFSLVSADIISNNSVRLY